MDWTFILTTLIPTTAIIIVGYILRNQIKSQKQTISKLQDYINTTSWEEVKKFYDTHKIPAEKVITRQEVISEYGLTPDQKNEIVDDYNELINYFYIVLTNLHSLNPTLAPKERILTSLSRNAKYFHDIWSDDKQQNLDKESNHQNK